MAQKNPAYHATVIANGEKIMVYKLKSGGWNRYMGDKLTLANCDLSKQTFTDDQLEIGNPVNNEQ